MTGHSRPAPSLGKMSLENKEITQEVIGNVIWEAHFFPHASGIHSSSAAKSVISATYFLDNPFTILTLHEDTALSAMIIRTYLTNHCSPLVIQLQESHSEHPGPIFPAHSVYFLDSNNSSVSSGPAIWIRPSFHHHPLFSCPHQPLYWAEIPWSIVKITPPHTLLAPMSCLSLLYSPG